MPNFNTDKTPSTMSTRITEQQKFDPWEMKQEIADVRVSILCCRYSMLLNWECRNLASPFWRIYHSRLGGAFIGFKKKIIEITPGTVVIIPPNTAFSSGLKPAHHTRYERIKSTRIKEEPEIALYSKEGMTDQMFVHFKLGFPYDRIEPGIYQFALNKQQESQVRAIEQKMIEKPDEIDFQQNLAITYFVLFTLQLLPSFVWDISRIDSRILHIIRYIEHNLAEPLSNIELSKIANLAKNSFARLFKENMKCAVQHFIQQRRIEHAITLFHHSNARIEELAMQCGFCDRYHFSHIFKKFTGVSPGNYRKKLR